MSLIAQLKRRNVFRVAAAYLVVGWLLTEVLTTILPTVGAPEWAARAVILIFAFGFIPAVIIAWVYEITPEGIKRDSEVERDGARPGAARGKLDYVVVGGVILLVLFLGFFSATQQDGIPNQLVSSAKTASIAVLPFVNMSKDKDNEYFSDGLTETLLHILAQNTKLDVTARTSSFAFKGQNKTIGEIAAVLGVNHVLEGSVQKSGDRVRITAQLIRAEDGYHVWSENYDRTLDDIFIIQDEIARKVSGALSVSLLGIEPETEIVGLSTQSSDAYDMYLQALKERTTFSYRGLQAAESLLKGALMIDPDFVEAKVELAGNFLHQAETGLLSKDEAMPQAIAFSEQVLDEHPNDAIARSIRLFAATALTLQASGPETLSDAVGRLESIVESDPAALQPKILLMRLYQMQHRVETALPLMQDALERDPFNAIIYYELGNLYLGLSRWNDAKSALRQSLEIEPRQPNAYANLALASLQTGDGLAYLKNFLKAIETDPVDHELPGIIAEFLYGLGLIDEGDSFRSRVLATAPRSEIAIRIELLRAIRTGDEEAGIVSARRAIEEDVDDRRFAFSGAVQYLLRAAIRNGTVADELDYLETQAPGIFDIEAASAPLKYRASQYVAFDAWYATWPREDVIEAVDKLVAVARSYGGDPESDPGIHVGILVLKGQTDEAIDVALQGVFTEPVAINLGWQRRYAQAQYADFVADPRIQSAMKRWEREQAALGAEVRQYLSELSASM